MLQLSELKIHLYGDQRGVFTTIHFSCIQFHAVYVFEKDICKYSSDGCCNGIWNYDTRGSF